MNSTQWTCLVLALAAGLVPGRAAHAQCAQIVTAASPLPGERMGVAVAFTSGQALVGGEGEVRVFVKTAGGWSASQVLVPPGAPASFGRSIAIDGGTAVIGAASSAFIYEDSGLGWNFVTELSASDATPGSDFGKAVDILGDRLVVGAASADVMGSATGAVYVFTDGPAGWQEEAKLVAPDASAGDGVGYSVGMGSNAVIVGAPFHGAGQTGAAYAFEFTTTWAFRNKVTAPAGAGNFGWATSMAGAMAIVGAPAGSGAFYTLLRNASGWFEAAVNQAADAADGAEFGAALFLTPTMTFVGAPGADSVPGFSGTGSAYFFERTATAWVERHRFDAPSPPAMADGVEFGASLAADIYIPYPHPIPPAWDLCVGAPGWGSSSGHAVFVCIDCNANGIHDAEDIGSGASSDCNENRIPDECELASGASTDLNANGLLDECECLVEPYCTATLNSTGFFARMASTGSPSLSVNAFSVDANGLPPGEFGIFFYGPFQVQLAFGDGVRCVGGPPLQRLDPPIGSDPGGNVFRALNFDVFPLNSFTAGDSTNFQFWFRDSQAMASGFNLTTGLAVEFCP